MLIISPTFQIPLREFTFTYARSSGPGGQNVNKVNTKALLRWPITTTPSLPEPARQRLLAKHARRITENGDLLIVSQRFRDAGRNVADCLEKLRAILLEAATPPLRRKATRPTHGGVHRRLQNKQRQSDKKQQRNRWHSES
jgi:ribosome-associated protein